MKSHYPPWMELCMGRLTQMRRVVPGFLLSVMSLSAPAVNGSIGSRPSDGHCSNVADHGAITRQRDAVTRVGSQATTFSNRRDVELFDRRSIDILLKTLPRKVRPL